MPAIHQRDHTKSKIMALITKKTKVLVQGITGKQGSYHTKLMLDYGTNIVAGVVPKRGGQEVEGVPVYNTVKEAPKAEWSVIFVPAPFMKKAAIEALENNLNLVIITEHAPVRDMIDVITLAKKKKLKVVGPNGPGFVVSGEAKLGIMPGHIFSKGNIGIVSRSGTLTYEIINLLTKANMGQSTCIGTGGDPVVGFDFIDILKLFEKDRATKKIVLIGEIGGDAEERAADYIKKNISKPVVAYIVGRSAPKGKTMGHAGAIISTSAGTVEAKTEAFEKAGVKVAVLPSEIVELLK